MYSLRYGRIVKPFGFYRQGILLFIIALLLRNTPPVNSHSHRNKTGSLKIASRALYAHSAI
ncbi:MAG: hypothetical protein WC401_12820, partial [Bacteroidales bacterium]